MKRTNNVKVRIVTITQAGSSVPGRPGNLIINQVGEVKPENWVSNREFRNALLGQKLSPSLPLMFFKGAVLVMDRIEIEPVDVEGGKTVKIPLPGKDSMGNPRVAEFKQVGIHNLNLRLDTDSIAVDRLMMMAELSMKFERRVTTLAPAAGSSAQETLTDEGIGAPSTNDAGNNAADQGAPAQNEQKADEQKETLNEGAPAAADLTTA